MNVSQLTLRPASLLCKFINVRAFDEALLLFKRFPGAFLLNWFSKLNTFEFNISWLIFAYKKKNTNDKPNLIEASIPN